MKSYTIGHHWDGPLQVCPRIVNAMEVRGEYPRKSHQGRQANWVLDYEFTRHGVYRVRSPRVAWRPRLARTAHLYPPLLNYWEDTRAEQGCRHSAWICFAGGEAAQLGRLLHPRLGYARFLDTHNQLGSLLREAAHIGRSDGSAGFWRAQAILGQVIDLLLHSRKEQEETWSLPRTDESQGTSDLVRVVDRYLRTRADVRTTLADIARHAHTSVSSLSHRYRQETGRTPMARLTQLRIGYARALILKGMPLKSIAAQLGFSDAFHLSRTFKRVEGISPRAFRGGAGDPLRQAQGHAQGGTLTGG